MDKSAILQCHTEQIHTPGSIQDRGLLIAINKETNLVSHVSENVEEFLPVSALSLLNQEAEVLDKYISAPNFLFSRHVAMLKTTEQPQGHFTIIHCKAGDYYLIHSNSNNFLVFETEPVLEPVKDAQEVYELIDAVISQQTVSEIMDSAVSEIKTLTGFERVMVYQFNADESGQVMAEAVDEHLEPFIGLCYPETDIPLQARELYKKNHTRLIHDAGGPTPAIISGSTVRLDLTRSVLRAVSPTHIAYLKNMKVGASYSVSIMDEGRLWGLISCHHQTAKLVDYKIRQATLLVAKVMISRISEELKDKNKQAERKFAMHYSRLQEYIIQENNLRTGLQKALVHLCQATDASGFVLQLEGQQYTQGQVPTQEQVTSLIDWCCQSQVNTVYFTDHLPRLYEKALAYYKKACGLLIIPLEIKDSYLIWFKKESHRVIQWAGNPHYKETALVNERTDLRQYIPRKSFAVWREQVSHQSESWSNEEVSSAQRVAHLISSSFQKENKQRSDYNSKLNSMARDLEFFSNTVSHDLKTPLTVIRSYAQLLLLAGTSMNAKEKDLAKKIMVGVDKMDEMITGVNQLTKINKNQITFTEVDVEKIIKDIVADHTIAHDYYKTKIEIGDTPQILGDYPLIYHCFSNIIGNALKYSSKTSQPRVAITGIRKEHYTCYKIWDNGIGIPEDEMAHIFDLFNRCRNAQEFEGSGIGLPIVQTILEKHNGNAWCISNLGEATAFYLVFYHQ